MHDLTSRIEEIQIQQERIIAHTQILQLGSQALAVSARGTVYRCVKPCDEAHII